MTREIKPCPFCGGEAVVDGTTWRASDGEEVCWISCRSCNGSSPADTPAEAIAAWNRRAETATPTVAEAARGLTIARLQRAHVDRQDEWCPDQKPDLSFRGNELGGECGEAQNVIKKLERERHGWRGSRDTVEHLGEELADVIHCAILCAITAGIDLEPAVMAKFDSTSEKNGLSTFLRAPAGEGEP